MVFVVIRNYFSNSVIIVVKITLIILAEKLDDVRAYLVENVKVDELLLSCVMKNSVISTKEKTEIQRVRISSLPVLLFL